MSTKNLSFEQALEELKSLVQSMEKGDAGLEQSLKSYEQATALRQHLEKLLDQAKLQVEQIQKITEGEMQTSSFDPLSHKKDQL